MMQIYFSEITLQEGFDILSLEGKNDRLVRGRRVNRPSNRISDAQHTLRRNVDGAASCAAPVTHRARLNDAAASRACRARTSACRAGARRARHASFVRRTIAASASSVHALRRAHTSVANLAV
jgi:hypothetical protein